MALEFGTFTSAFHAAIGQASPPIAIVVWNIEIGWSPIMMSVDVKWPRRYREIECKSSTLS